jgi:hypothetical protein
MFFDKSISQLTADDLRDFVDLNRSEGLHLDYKSNHPADWRKIPKKKHEVRNEKQLDFLRHVSAFANAEGGMLFYGINDDEESGLPSEITPFTEDDPEGVKQQLSNLCRARIEPPLNIGIELVEFDEGEFVAVLDVPESYAAPHMVIDGRRTDFFQRHSGGSERMGYEALRHRFARQAGLIERVRDFRHRRVKRLNGDIDADEVPPISLHTSNPPRYGLHIVPVPRFGSTEHLEYSELVSDYELLKPLNGIADRRWFNLEGMTVYREEPRSKGNSRWATGYTLLFRNGTLEAFNTEFDVSNNERPSFSIAKIVREIAEALTRFAEFYRQNQIGGPFAVFFSMANARKATLNNEANNQVRLDRSPLLLPEIMTSDIDGLDSCLRPLLTLLSHALHLDSLDESLVRTVNGVMDSEKKKLNRWKENRTQ